MAKKKNTENERFRNNLLAVVSHELNTPLTAILGAISVLEERFPTENEYVPMLRRNAERLNKTIANLMELSRADAGVLRVRLSEVDLENFLRLRVEALREGLDKKNFSLELEIEADLPHVCADPRRLSHAFDSLVHNAVKFSDLSKLKGGGRALISVHLSLDQVSEIPNELLRRKEAKTGMYLQVSVASSLTSIGDSPESFEQLFEPFSPWRDADTRSHEGLGVELALTKEILYAHEGYIWATFPQQDARDPWIFHFALPVLSRLDELELVVSNRMHSGIGIVGKLSLLLLRGEPGGTIPEDVRREIIREVQRVLFRASDSAFWLEDSAEFVVLLDDCDHQAAERVGIRLIELLVKRFPDLGLLWATATGPDDGANASELLEKARFSWRPGA